VKKPQTNYAFADGTNLHRTMQEIGWDLDYHRFRIYLSEHYGVGKAYYFIGYMPENTPLYTFLQSVGYVIIFKPILKTPDGKVKGNCDAELVTSYDRLGQLRKGGNSKQRRGLLLSSELLAREK